MLFRQSVFHGLLLLTYKWQTSNKILINWPSLLLIRRRFHRNSTVFFSISQYVDLCSLLFLLLIFLLFLFIALSSRSRNFFFISGVAALHSWISAGTPAKCFFIREISALRYLLHNKHFTHWLQFLLVSLMCSKLGLSCLGGWNGNPLGPSK